ncbi:ABC transporter substrate-binding protein [Alkaliphilus serpentinus]|uniref:histidine kinase n=1 Tax=Alkaliphilus serpentinus TaxID=1482731 RepID=A0A833HRE7_9FIRM|nr:ABC transporter substrate-binding protein [Alkaliphilus serpentinus]KAB3533228.1 hypothetical protein F8153_01385 [Alkaliphilus serpentinus]
MENKRINVWCWKGLLNLTIIFTIFFVEMGTVYGKAPEKVTLQLRWDHQFQFAGYYAANWLGFYEEEGLEVEILPGFSEDRKIHYATQEVAEGRAHFGVGAVDTLIARNQGYEFSIVASIFQRSPVEFYMLEETPFYSLVDLVDLNTARRKNDLLDIELQAMLLKEGINPDQLEVYDEDLDFSIKDLTLYRFDVIPGYLGTISYYAEKADVDLKVIRPIDYGIDFYGDSLFTRKTLADSKPEMVEAFKRASLKGWVYALENPEEIIKRMVEEYGETVGRTHRNYYEFNKFQAERVEAYTLYPVVEIGNINPHRWAAMEDALLKLDLLKEEINWDEFIFDYERIENQRRERQDAFLLIFSVATAIFLVILLVIHITAKNTMRQLEIMVQRELKENQKKEALIIYQAKLAAMGEMIANIAHQWRQPLNNLGLVLANIEDSYRHNELDGDYLNSSIERSKKLITKMSETIDDFRYFLKPQTNMDYFNIYDSIISVLELLEENLKFNSIHVDLKKNADAVVYGYGNQFSQAIFNIISNSIDALSNGAMQNKEIRISIDIEKDRSIIEIWDNGGGIDPSIGERIFEIYFTTKNEGKGTGLGLYITKMIIENNMKGVIYWKNQQNGLLLRLEIPPSRGGVR